MSKTFSNRIIFSRRCLEYSYPFHIESRKRVEKAYEFLKDLKYKFIEPIEASEHWILNVHTKDYIDKLKNNEIKDLDTPGHENIYYYASLSAGAAIVAGRTLGFSLMRPPGHHAGIKGVALNAPTLGFCYLNNIAIAIRAINKKTIIIDIDGHHGNGTEEIFLGDENVIFISLHRKGIYPNTGLTSQKNCFNYPLEADCGEKVYLKTFEKALNEVEKIIKNKNFELIAISFGADALNGDIASLGLNEDSYYKIGKLIAKLNLPIFAVLEGGYTLKLGNCIHNFIQGILSND